MISIEHVTKRYGGRTVVDDVSFTCHTGTVTGFLGPNGAGKSTTMRILCGLTPATSGTTTVHGVPFVRLPNPGRQVGVLLDASAQHKGRTGREVLTLAAMVLGVPRTRVGEALERVGLSQDAAGKRMGKYSLGMRQRLGIAHALLGEPNVLVLDEPANGLDPEGIHAMRVMLRDFADRGGTVLLSSHLLREVEAVADHLVVIGGGRIVADGSPEELMGSTSVIVRSAASDVELLARALEAASLSAAPRAAGGFLVEAPPEAVGLVAHRAGVPLAELRQADGTRLEDLFLRLTGTPGTLGGPGVVPAAPAPSAPTTGAAAPSASFQETHR